MKTINFDPVKKANTEKVLLSIKNLPSIPKVIFEVTKLLEDPSTTTNKLAEIISKDQGLTLKILSVANSPLYGIRRKVSSIEFAILVLGFKDMKDIVTAISFADSFKISTSQEFEPMDFWIHSMLAGTAAKSIAQCLGFNLGGDAFVAGIIHDIGILVIHKYMYKEFLEIIKLANTQNIPIFEAEYQVLGLSHQEIGRFLCEKWQLPAVLCDTINHHHQPSLGTKNNVITSIIHLVDYMTQKLNIGSFFWDTNMELDPSILETLHFESMEDLDKFTADYKELFEVSSSSLRF